MTIPVPRLYSSNGNAEWGLSFIQLGTGDNTPTYEDYALQSPVTSGLTLNTVSTSYSYDSDTHTYTRTYKIPIAYSGSDPITIKEFGIFCGLPYTFTSNNVYQNPILVYRETLDTSVTLEQNDTIEITFSQSIVQPNYTSYPTA
jgi:hypothetical protein